KLPEHGVVLEQVRHRLYIAEVVCGDDLELAAPLHVCTEEIAADAAETVDAHADLRHLSPGSFWASLARRNAATRSARSPIAFSGMVFHTSCGGSVLARRRIQTPSVGPVVSVVKPEGEVVFLGASPSGPPLFVPLRVGRPAATACGW